VTLDEGSLRRVIEILEALAIPYMVTGSLASSHHGRPRTTEDADFVIEPTQASLERLVAALTGAGFYADADHARDAFRRRRQFNAIDTLSGFKVDFIVRKEHAFSLAEFARRQRRDLVPGLPVSIATAEDTVVAKLDWARKAGESEKQLKDVAGIVDALKDLDRDYVARWSEELGVLDLWQRVTSRS
jgi:hypothetical protein